MKARSPWSWGRTHWHHMLWLDRLQSLFERWPPDRLNPEGDNLLPFKMVYSFKFDRAGVYAPLVKSWQNCKNDSFEGWWNRSLIRYEKGLEWNFNELFIKIEGRVMLAWVEIQKQLWSVKACPANLHGWFWVLALPLVVAPPNLQNQLTWTSEGTLNYYGFNRSLQNASVGGEGLEKYNPGKSICIERLDH